MKKNLFLSIALLMLLLACSPEKPSIEIVKSKLEEKITKQSKGLIKLVFINKTDGLESEINGVRMYEFTYNYEIEILKNVFKCGYGGFESPSFQENFVVSDQKPVQRGFIPIRCTLFKKGVKITLFDKATFYKSENGWQSGKFK